MSDLPELREGLHYRVDSHTGCWTWLGRLDRAGYALHGRGKAGRLVWEARHGPIPPNLLLRHRVCSNPACVRLEHLALGTHADNGDDMRRANRGSRHNARLKPSDIPDILRRLDAGEAGEAIGRDYGVTASAINKIRSGATWRHEIGETGRSPAGPSSQPVNAGRGTGTPVAVTSGLGMLALLPSTGALVRRRREQLGLTQRDLGVRLGCGANFISMVEDERTRLPLARFKKWADVLELPWLVVAAVAMNRRRDYPPEFMEMLFGEKGLVPDRLKEAVIEALDRLARGRPPWPDP
jgi:transcriptional regulator with XRE-family HTH domain